MTRQQKRYAERQADKAAARKPKIVADADDTARRFRAKIVGLPLKRIEKEYHRVYDEARQMERVLAKYHMENEGRLPLLTAKEAPLVLAIGNKFYYLAAELARRGVTPYPDMPLGGPMFCRFFSSVADATRQTDKTVLGTSFLSRFTSSVRRLFRGKL